MSRCGCGTICSCAEQGRYGHAVSGAGTANNPYVHRFDPRVNNILGSGLVWSETDKKLSALVSGDAGNDLIIGSDNGLYVSAGGDPTPGGGGASVSNLPAQDVLGGLAGAGYLHCPENLLRSYQRAVTLGLDMVHVPVQALRDGAAVSHTDVTVERITDSTGGRQPNLRFKPGDVDTQRWSLMPLVASRYYMTGNTLETSFVSETGLHSRPDPVSGFFGYHEWPQQGGTFCADIAQQVGGKIVIVWHLLSGGKETADLQRVIRHYRLVQSSIVISGDLKLLDTYRAMGCAIGAVVSNGTEAAANTPAAITAAGAKWAFVSIVSPDVDPTVYTNADPKLEVIAFPAQYHNEYNQINGWLKMRGALSPDPVYYSGPRPTSNYGYRHERSSWEQGTVEYGQYNDFRGFGEMNGPARRGYTVWGHNSLFLSSPGATWHPLAPNAGDTTTGPWWIQQGWLAKVPAPASYTIAWWNRWRYLAQGYKNYVCVAFGVEADHQFRSGPQAGFKGELDVGYVLKIEWGAGLAMLEDHKQGGGVDTYPMSNPGGAPVTPDLGLGSGNDLGQNKVEDCWGIRVNGAAGKIEVVYGKVDRSGTGRLTGEQVVYTHNEIAHTGPYVYIGMVDGHLGHPEMGCTFRHLTRLDGALALPDIFNPLWP